MINSEDRAGSLFFYLAPETTGEYSIAAPPNLRAESSQTTPGNAVESRAKLLGEGLRIRRFFQFRRTAHPSFQIYSLHHDRPDS
jgi:hypothetical protein